MNWLHSLEREAGFYTTRFGRSDPLMRVQELQARHHPDQQDEDDSNRLTQASDPDCGYKTVKKMLIHVAYYRFFPPYSDLAKSAHSRKSTKNVEGKT